MLFIDDDAPSPLAACGPGGGPCAASSCDVYDPREYVLRHVPIETVPRLVVRVVELENGAPIDKAVVRIAAAGVDVGSQETNAMGLAQFAPVAAGSLEIVAHSDGFEAKSVTPPLGARTLTLRMEENRLRLYDREHHYMAGAPCRIVVDGRNALETHSDASGYVSLRHLGKLSTCTVMWAPPGSARGIFLYALDIHLDGSLGDGEGGSRERMNNLGYPIRQPLAASVRAFQRDFRDFHGLKVTGELDARTVDAIRAVHTRCADKIRSS